jgi:2-polyprenyl-3-methyl-5-hydroxy-6-metoxy-1,4-benzoquinol methylase
MDRKEIVRQGYDKVSYAYRNERGDDEFSDYASWLAELTALVPSAAAILDLGCGCGVPVAQSLARDYAVTGVDISPVQIERARRTVPHATFVCADMSEVDFPARSFAAIVSFYAIIHLPLSEQPGLLARIHQWLEPHGYAMLIVGSESWTGVEEDWLGVAGATMYWSHADSRTYQSWLTQLGFSIQWTRFIPEGQGGHEILLAQKSSEQD